MARPVTLFTGQWADLPLEELAGKAQSWGFDGLELACWGDHFEVDRALADDAYCREKRELLERSELDCWAIGAHLFGQAVCDPIGNREGFGINLDPSHFAHQHLDTAKFALEFPDRIYHVHVKDSRKRLDGRRSILASHLNFGEEERGWDFVSPGHGDVDFEEVFRALNRIGYQGPLSIEWEDSGMDREWGAQDAIAFVRRTDFAPSEVAFDAAMQR